MSEVLYAKNSVTEGVDKEKMDNDDNQNKKKKKQQQQSNPSSSIDVDFPVESYSVTEGVDEEKMDNDDNQNEKKKKKQQQQQSNPSSSIDVDFSVESFRLKMEEISDWIDRTAVYDQDDSTKGNTNPKSHHHHHNPFGSNSQRFSGNLTAKPKKPPIIGLPQLQHSSYLGRSSRRHSMTSGRLFPKRKTGKSAVAVWEPRSPRVSCFGKVRSEREGVKLHDNNKDRGCFPFSFCWNNKAVKSVEDDETMPEKSKHKKLVEAVPAAAVVPVAPGLGGLKRFSSRRRAASWGDVDLGLGFGDDDEDVERSGPLGASDAIWGRTSFGSPNDLDFVRDWDDVGPASV